jgi:simple sugar transport system permease protein
VTRPDEIETVSTVQETPTVAARYQRAGGFITPLVTTLVAFFLAGLVVVATTGKNPLPIYRGILDGTGLTWLVHWFVDVRTIGGTHELYRTEADAVAVAAISLQQTLILTTTLILTGLAVAFAFRCGLFNIGGQGQYFVGVTVAVAIGAELGSLPRGLHVPLALACAALAGAAWAGIAGLMRATVGAHEVITTIMLNWIAFWVGSYLFSLGGPLQSDTQRSVPISNDVADSAKLHVLWGGVQGLHIGFLIALGALVVFWALLNRTTLGFAVRAVGYNPEAARYGGISVARNYFLAMAIAGGFAGLAGAIDLLGWQYRYGQIDVQQAEIGFVGIAVALLGRNTAFGILCSALLFGALLTGTSTRNLNPDIFDAELAGNLTLIIQGLVVLFVGADLLVLSVWRVRKRLRLPRWKPRRSPRPVVRRREPFGAPPHGRLERADERERAATQSVSEPTSWSRQIGWAGIGAAVLGVWLMLPPLGNDLRDATRWFELIPVALGILGVAAGIWTASRSERKVGWAAIVCGLAGIGLGLVAAEGSMADHEAVFVWSSLIAATLRWATPLIFAAIGGMFSERSGVVNIALEGMMLAGAFFGIWGAVRFDHWAFGLATALAAGGALALIHAFFSIHLRADQIVSGTAINFLALGLTGYLYIDIYGDQGIPTDLSTIPNVHLSFLDGVYFVGPIFGDMNLMIWLAFATVVLSWIVMFKTPIGLRVRSVGEHPRAADTVGISVYKLRYGAVIVSGMLAALGGAYLSIGFVGSFGENMTVGRGFIALAALIFGMWKPFGAFGAALLFGFSSALARSLPEYSEQAGLLFETLPYVLTLIAVGGLIGRSIPPAAIGRPYEKQ